MPQDRSGCLAVTLRSQKDLAELTAEDAGWSDDTIGYSRHKLEHLPELTIKPPIIHFSEEVAAILKSLPQSAARSFRI